MAKAEVVITAVDRTQQAIQSAQKGMKGLNDTALVLQRTLGAVSVAAVGAFFVRSANQALTFADSINKAATRAGVTTEAMSELAYAAKLADADLNTVVKAINLMQRGLGEAAVGTGEAKKGLEMLGISLETLQALKPESQFKFLADAIMALQDPSDRITVGMKIFGRSFAELLPLFEDGSEGMNRAAEEARKLNLVISGELADASSEAKDNIDKLTGAWQGFTTQIMGGVAPALTTILTSLTALSSFKGLLDILASIPSGGATLGTRIGQRMIDESVAIQAAGVSSTAGEDFRQSIIDVDAIKKAEKEAAKLRETQFDGLAADVARNIGLLESVRMQLIETADANYEALQTVMADIPDLSKQAADQMTIFAEQAARNMQSAFADFLFDPFQNGLKGMVKGFVDAIRRMVAEFAASQLMKFFFTPFASGSGLLASFAKFAIGGKAMGGSVLGNKPYIVGERGPELFVPGSNGSIVPNDRMGGVTVAPVYNIDARGATADLQKALPGILQENNRRIFDELDRRYGIGR